MIPQDGQRSPVRNVIFDIFTRCEMLKPYVTAIINNKRTTITFDIRIISVLNSYRAMCILLFSTTKLTQY